MQPMSKAEVITIAKKFVDVIKGKYLVKMVILLQAYPGVFDKIDGEIELAVVIDHLRKDEDYVEILQEMRQYAAKVDSRLDVELIEREKKDPTGFFKQIQKTGEVIYNRQP
jgi:hypothetical protein